MSGRAARLGLALVGLTVALPGGVAGQDPDRPDSLRDGVAPAPAPSVPTAPPVPRFGFSLTVGTLGFSDLQVQPVLAERPAAGDADPESWLLRRHISAGGYHVQGSALVSLGPAWAVRVGAGVGRAELEVGYGGGDGDALEEVRSLPAAAGGSLGLVSVEGALRFRIPSRRRLAPYAELGVAQEWWSLGGSGDPVLPGAESLLNAQRRTAVHLGVGGTIRLTGGLDARLQATTRYLRTPLAPGTPATPVAGGDSLSVTLAAPGMTPFADGTVELLRIMRLEAGLTLRLGPVAGAARNPSTGSGAGPSGTRP